MRTRFWSLLGAAALLVTASCTDTISTVFGEGCNAGTIKPGQDLAGSLNESSCFDPSNFWSGNRTAYQSYTVNLEKGKAYLFFEGQIADADHEGRDDLDALLGLWGRSPQGASVPLAISDDDANGPDGHDSEIFFVAPDSGRFQLVAGAYDGLGGYHLQARECPVLGALDTAGTYHFSLKPSPCIRHGYGLTRYNFLTFNAESLEEVGITVTSSDFVPTWEMGGPGFDVYENLYDGTDYTGGSGSGDSGTLTFDGVRGQVTLAIGDVDGKTAGEFTVTLTRTPPALSAPRLSGRMQLKSTFPIRK